MTASATCYPGATRTHGWGRTRICDVSNVTDLQSAVIPPSSPLSLNYENIYTLYGRSHYRPLFVGAPLDPYFITFMHHIWYNNVQFDFIWNRYSQYMQADSNNSYISLCVLTTTLYMYATVYYQFQLLGGLLNDLGILSLATLISWPPWSITT